VASQGISHRDTLRSCRRADRQADGDLLLLLLRHDRPACLPHDRRRGPAYLAAAARSPRGIWTGLLHADGTGRAVLALRRHRVDLPVPVVVPDQPARRSPLDAIWPTTTR